MSSEAPPAGAHGTDRLPDILLRSLKLLADTGEVDQACRLAGEACVALRKVDHHSAQASMRFCTGYHGKCRGDRGMRTICVMSVKGYKPT